MNSFIPEAIRAEEIILYGASSSGARAFNNLIFSGCNKNKISFFDSNEEKQGKSFLGRKVLSLDELLTKNKDVLIFITSCLKYEISNYLDSLEFNNFHYHHGLVYSNKVFDKFNDEFISILNLIGEESNIDFDELYTIYKSCKAVNEIEGDVAEIGVYKGGSAYLIASAMKNKKIYLFDTFSGLPEEEKKVSKSNYKNSPLAGWLHDTTVENVSNFVISSGIRKENIIIREGLFPKTAEDLEENIFCLVHIDTDLYSSTIDALNFFYPRLSKGGRIISHDYNCVGTPGVKKAFDEFLNQKNYRHGLVEVAESQALIIKV